MPILALRFCSSTQHKPIRFYVYLLPLPLGTKPRAERTESSMSLTWVPLCRLHLKRQKELFKQLSLNWGGAGEEWEEQASRSGNKQLRNDILLQSASVIRMSNRQ